MTRITELEGQEAFISRQVFTLKENLTETIALHSNDILYMYY